MSNSNVYRYTISEKNTLIKIIDLIFGKFRTSKIIYLHKAIDRINFIYENNLEKLPLYTSKLKYNA